MFTFIHCNSAGGEMGKYTGTHMRTKDNRVEILEDYGDDAVAVISLLPGHVVYRDAKAEKEAS